MYSKSEKNLFKNLLWEFWSLWITTYNQIPTPTDKLEGVHNKHDRTVSNGNEQESVTNAVTNV